MMGDDEDGSGDCDDDFPAMMGLGTMLGNANV